MILREPHIPLFELVASISRAIDLMDSQIGNHHARVAYLSYQIAGELGLPIDDRRNLFMAGALHDIGAFSAAERKSLQRFESEQPHQHAIAGAVLLAGFRPFQAIVPLVRYHHVPWQNGEGATFQGEPVPEEAQLLFLADRASVLIDDAQPVLRQVEKICNKIQKRAGTDFIPRHVEAFMHLARKEYIWLELVSHDLEAILRRKVRLDSVELDMDALIEFAQLLSRIIDFKSAFTATHSTGVATTAVALSTLLGFSHREQQMMKVAAFLHDLGKLAIPSELLEKEAKLTDEERDLNILEMVEDLDLINAWGALHQERLNGSGYPFGRSDEDLSLGSRIMAVADVFTALTEDRPYRKGMAKEGALQVLRKMADDSELDKRVVTVLEEQFDTLNGLRADAQTRATREYEEFRAAIA